MIRTHNLGFPRIGARRELKTALESHWRGQSDEAALQRVARELRGQHWKLQSRLDRAPVGDFSLYDHVLDASAMLGNLPERATRGTGTVLHALFRAARGAPGVAAADMTKWFDTNYHYLAPEFTARTRFAPDASTLLSQLDEARALGIRTLPVLLGPMTYLALGRDSEGDPLRLVPALTRAYESLLAALCRQDVDWIRIDEPILSTDLDERWKTAFRQCHEQLLQTAATRHRRLMLSTCFGPLRDNLPLVTGLPYHGLHVDAVRGRDEVEAIVDALPADRTLSLGVVDGRNVWRTDLRATLAWLEPIAARLAAPTPATGHEAVEPPTDRLWLAPSCSLLHVPIDLESETDLAPAVRRWLAFATQKLDELSILAAALNEGRQAVVEELADNQAAMNSRRSSSLVNDSRVRQALAALDRLPPGRDTPHAQRALLQARDLALPRFPTTTIGSFPQTPQIREARSEHRAGRLDDEAYRAAMHAQIQDCIQRQETLGLDVLVHGEAERNDMVEYFGELLQGFAITRNGWVQSYGSRCVKPPILYGDVRRTGPMTVQWIQHAQSLTARPVKGMLTGPVTLLNWAFVRNDQPREATCRQLALAVRDEVLDLERAGIRIIQIDEAALREGLPLRHSDRADYLRWAVECFRLAASGVQDATQIHTHMCYSEFNDILPAIADMDADVITIETSRSDMALLDAFEAFEYPNQIGPGVYDIHSPQVPDVEQIVERLQLAGRRIPAERLWVNPDCGLKTRHWDEVMPALANMVSAARRMRATN